MRSKGEVVARGEARGLAPEIGLADEQRRAVVDILNRTLADEFLLYTKTRNYHWNVTGLQFGELHRFFEEQYRQLNDIVDRVAERVRALGGWSLGTLQEFQGQGRLTEEPGQIPDAPTMLANLLRDHEALIRHLREDQRTCLERYNDAGTNNFLVDLMERHEKMAWMLRAYLEGPSA